jgi:hypothetical protein
MALQPRAVDDTSVVPTCERQLASGAQIGIAYPLFSTADLVAGELDGPHPLLQRRHQNSQKT